MQLEFRGVKLDFLKRLKSEIRCADIIFVMLGGNDITRHQKKTEDDPLRTIGQATEYLRAFRNYLNFKRKNVFCFKLSLVTRSRKHENGSSNLMIVSRCGLNFILLNWGLIWICSGTGFISQTIFIKLSDTCSMITKMVRDQCQKLLTRTF